MSRTDSVLYGFRMDRHDTPLSYNFMLLMELANNGPSFSNALTIRLSEITGFQVGDSVVGRSLRRLRKRNLVEQIEDPDKTDMPAPGKPRVVYQVTEPGIDLLLDQETFIREIIEEEK